MNSTMDCITLEHGGSPSHSVIWLHGLGADGSDFVPVVPDLGLPAGVGVRFLFPNAPEMPVTCNGGYTMPAWYDILSLSPNARRIDEAGLLQSRDRVSALIAQEIALGIPAARIFLAGFSQGGAVAYMTALSYPQRLGGLIALSTYVPSTDLLDACISEANRTLPVFAAHGEYDDVVSPGLGKQARDFLLARGYGVDWRTYPIAHSVCLEEIQAIGCWLGERMS
ncbi:MAG: alpha/beta hydrolase [Azonexus sp.]|nr:alpha/beta hydrolase [Azonexus sp.]